MRVSVRVLHLTLGPIPSTEDVLQVRPMLTLALTRILTPRSSVLSYLSRLSQIYSTASVQPYLRVMMCASDCDQRVLFRSTLLLSLKITISTLK